MKLHQQPFNRNTNRRNSTCCSYLKPERNPKQEPAPTACSGRSGCRFCNSMCCLSCSCALKNSNAQEQDKQHIELQKQHPELSEQAPPHEIASAALQQKHQQKEQHMLLIPQARTKPKAGTGTNCNLNAQEQDKQHIELQKQHPDLPEQAPPHEIVQQPFNRISSRRNSRCCSYLYLKARTRPKAGTGTNCN